MNVDDCKQKAGVGRGGGVESSSFLSCSELCYLCRSQKGGIAASCNLPGHTPRTPSGTGGRATAHLASLLVSTWWQCCTQCCLVMLRQVGWFCRISHSRCSWEGRRLGVAAFLQAWTKPSSVKAELRGHTAHTWEDQAGDRQLLSAVLTSVCLWL